MTNDEGLDKARAGISEEDLKRLLLYIEGIHYGSVTLFIQGGKIVQIEKNEKIKIK